MLDALFQTIETQNMVDSEAAITLIPKNSQLLGELVAATQGAKVSQGLVK